MNNFKTAISKKDCMINIINIAISLLLTLLLLVMWEYNANNYSKVSAWMAVVLMSVQILLLIKKGNGFFSFEIWFLIFSYLFMFGQIFLSGLLGLEHIVALGYKRPILDARYNDKILFKASLFVLLCIQYLNMGFCMVKKSDSYVSRGQYNKKIYLMALVFGGIGIPCHLLTSIRMILSAQSSKSYGAISSQAGLVDDLANFLIYGFICLIFSNRFNKKMTTVICGVLCCYLSIVMMLTGDRRYQIVSIIVLFLAYMKNYNVKFRIRYIGFAVLGYLFLTMLFILREIRTSNLVSINEFLLTFWKTLTDSDTNILVQTLYEFGGSIYSVCLAVEYMPNTVAFRYGATFFTGIVRIIPLGFLYNSSSVVEYGSVTSELMMVGKTTVGGSMWTDLYGNFQLVGGFVAAFFIGLVMAKIMKHKKCSNNGAYYEIRNFILFFSLIHLVRASFTEVIRTAVWGVATLYILNRFIRSKKSNE